jgi:multidrug efflux system membrane fusion protein
VDPSTGTTAIKATFANRSQHLVPGAYVKGSLELQRLHQVLLIPQVAIQTGQKGPFVFVAQGKVARVRQLQLGPASGEQVVVRAGLREGDKVVTKGQFALSPGAAIRLAKKQTGPAKP